MLAIILQDNHERGNHVYRTMQMLSIGATYKLLWFYRRHLYPHRQTKGFATGSLGAQAVNVVYVFQV